MLTWKYMVKTAKHRAVFLGTTLDQIKNIYVGMNGLKRTWSFFNACSPLGSLAVIKLVSTFHGGAYLMLLV